ncbi:MAG: AmmeMemoRadiSam system protein B [Proteobacteria bacterium]|nr:AmmeMemoRadiSam system protein B [Pseudomonadota bacterium]
MKREPAVAGQFYPGTRSSLEAELARYLKSEAKPKKALGAVAPHAGYVYSGAVAGKVFAGVVVPERCIVLCPNHTGQGARAAVWARGSWSIPTGDIPVDEKLAQALLESCSDLKEDPTAHLGEHSLEVELPFLLARQPALSIVPICISRADPAALSRIGEAIAKAIRAAGGDILIVASTDMNHYESDARTREKDNLAIEKVLKLDAEGLVDTCAHHRISMCGVLPTAILIHACRALGAKRAELVAHATSGDVSGDRGSVVGYAGFIVD